MFENVNHFFLCELFPLGCQGSSLSEMCSQCKVRFPLFCQWTDQLSTTY